MRRIAIGRRRVTKEARTPCAPHEMRRHIDPIRVRAGRRGPRGGGVHQNRQKKRRQKKSEWQPQPKEDRVPKKNLEPKAP